MRIDSGLLPGHVLQRTAKGASAKLVGTATAAGRITATIALAGKTVRGWARRAVGRAAYGAFSVKLAGIPIGGPYTVTLAVGDERAEVRDVWVGDLWLMAGQSNMEGCGDLADASQPHAQVRAFSMANRWGSAREPLHHLAESPDLVHNGGTQETREQAARSKRARIKGAGVGTRFGNLMQERTGVPQGLIAAAHGGTTMEMWDPARRELGGASLYGSLLATMRAVGQPIAGVLWYQGEGDTNPEAVPQYTRRMQEFVAAVRADLRQPKLPFIVVQIGRVIGNEGAGPNWNALQEQQRLLPAAIGNLGVVPAIDLELDDLIHISGRAFAHLAERMARVAARLRGDRSERPGPEPLSARLIADPSTHDPVIEVRFANVEGALHSGSSLPTGFSVVDRQLRPLDIIFKTVLDGSRARLHLTTMDAVALRLMYGRGSNPTCNLLDARGMAVPVFGPLPIAGFPMMSSWLLGWDVSPIRHGEDVANLPRPTRDTVPGVERREWSVSGFVNCHDAWSGRSGHVVFFANVEAAEDMETELCTGYDGPFRLWVDDREVHCDPAGTNPAIADRVRIALRLDKGRHRLTVLMALNRGLAWGFFMRFARPGVEDADIESGKRPLPVACW